MTIIFTISDIIWLILGGLTLLAVLGVVIWLGVVGLADKIKQRVWQSRVSEDEEDDQSE